LFHEGYKRVPFAKKEFLWNIIVYVCDLREEQETYKEQIKNIILTLIW